MVLLVGTTGRDAEEERAVVNSMLQRSIRGLVIVPAYLDYGAARLPLGAGGVPVVFVDRPPINMSADVVTIDNVAIARHATEHLIAHGHCRIAFAATSVEAGGASHYPVIARLNGYRAALEASAIPYDPALVVYTSAARARACICWHRSSPAPTPTAFLGANELASLAVVAELRRAGRTDVAIVTVDDFPMAMRSSRRSPLRDRIRC